MAGIVSRTVVSPLEVVATINICSTRSSLGLTGELRKLVLEEGVRGLFKGNAANCMKVAPTKGIQFLAFEGFKRWIFALRDPDSPRFSSPLTPLERLAAGGAAGIAAATFCYPLEVAKTLLTAHPEKYNGVFRTIALVVKQQGPKALYRGLAPTVIAMFPYVGLEFMIYEQLKLLYTRRKQKEPNVITMLLIGAFAGTISQTVCHPLDVVRKRLQLQGIGGRPVQYRSMMDAAVGIVRNEGPRSLYRGLHPTYMSVLPSAGVSYVVYESVKNLLGVQSFK